MQCAQLLEVTEFKCLGNTLHGDRDMDKEVNKRM